MIIRRDDGTEAEAIHAVQDAAFRQAAHASGHEAELVDALRDSDEWLPLLSMVAEEDGRIIGHVVCSRGAMGAYPALGLGPIGVLPERQGSGVGAALMHAVLGAADALGESAVALLGEPKFYSRFGFVPAARHGVTPPVPEWGDYFQLRTLTAWRDHMAGAFTYASPFDRFG